jgi:dTDP-glucose 4,6-dehydratase
MRLLVCGGAGFIGSNFVRLRLRESGDEVVVLDKLTYAGRQENFHDFAEDPGFRFVHGAIEDPQAVARALDGGGPRAGEPIEAIVNFAAETHVDRSIAEPDAFVRTHSQGTYVLLEAARERELRYLQVSTDEVYGSIEDGSFTEESPLRPSSPYSATKTGADLLVQSYFHTYGLPATICRGSNNYGAYQYPEKVIPLFVTNLLDGQQVPLYGDGGNVRGWIHVDDHCRGIQLVLERGRAGETYHIDGDTELTNLELTAALLECCGAGWDMVTRVPDRKGHDRRYSLDDSTLRAMGYAPRVPFRQGLEATVRWYADNRAWWEPLKRQTAAPAPAGSGRVS